MRIRRVKYNGQKVTIEYEKEKGKDTEQADTLLLVSADQPIESFKKALQALSSDVVNICEFQGGDVDVRGCSFSWTKDNMGVVITALKPVQVTNAPLVVNTPHMTEKSTSANDADSGGTMPRGMVKKLKTVLMEAERYVSGTRAPQKQGTLKGMSDDEE